VPAVKSPFFLTCDSVSAGLLPPPELPLPPGLDSASAVPYQQKPIDLFKAIFEGSDSEEDDDSDKGDQKEDERANDKYDMDTAEKGRSHGAQGPAQPAEQITMSKGISQTRICSHDPFRACQLQVQPKLLLLDRCMQLHTSDGPMPC